MNAGIRTGTTDEIVRIHTVRLMDSTEDVAPEISGYFLALPGRNRGRGERRVLLETDRILLIVGWGNVPGQIVSPANFHRLGVGLAVGNGHPYMLGWLPIIGVAATENPQ
jgi:hypothetical protein